MRIVILCLAFMAFVSMHTCRQEMQDRRKYHLDFSKMDSILIRHFIQRRNDSIQIAERLAKINNRIDSLKSSN